MSEPQPTSLDAPALTPPPGVTPYFEDPFTIGPYVALPIVGCIITTTTLVALRVFTKARVLKSMQWEDYTCIMGWACFMIMMALHWSLTSHGGGIHQWNVTFEQVQYSYRFTNYGDIIYSLAMFFTKLSILLLILRVFCSVRRNIPYYLTIFLIGVNSIFYTLYFFIPIFLCRPRIKIWQKDQPGHCLKVDLLYLASAIFNSVSDIAMLSVPLYLIWKLQMSVGRKIAVSAVFGTGALACIASLIRIVYIVFLIRTKDYNFVSLQATLWAFAEIACGLLCGCLPIIPALFRYYTSIPPQIYRDPSSKAAINRLTSPKSKASATGEQEGREWIHLDGRSSPTSFGKGRSRSGDEEALEEAVNGVGPPRQGEDAQLAVINYS